MAKHKLTLALLFLVASVASADVSNVKSVQKFINHMVQKHHFKKQQLNALFQQVSFNEKVLQKIANPYEAKPWYIYQKHFLTDENLMKGLAFWQEHEKDLQKAEKQYGVPASVIVAIIGVETKYGEHPGDYRVIDALSSLAFKYPPRSKFFKKELEHYLLLTKEKNLDPLSLHGSYAGAIGIPQFMPSSYRHFAVDFSGHGKVDLQRNIVDVIGSVANYMHRHGWRAGDVIALPAVITGTEYKKLRDARYAKYSMPRLRRFGITTNKPVGKNSLATLVPFELKVGNEYWLGFHNFFVITKYNTSPLYAMAVFQLSQQLSQLRNHEK